MRKNAHASVQAPHWHPAKTLDEVWKPGTERTFVFYGPEKNGKRQEAGWNWCRYGSRKQGRAKRGGWLLHCKVSLDAGKLGNAFGGVIESDSHILLDDRAVPIRLWGRGNMAGAFDFRFGPKKVSIQAAGKHLEVDWPGGIPVLLNNHPVIEELLLAMVGPEAGRKVRFNLFSPSGALVIPYEATVKSVGTAHGPGLEIHNGFRETIFWHEDSMVSVDVGDVIRILPEKRPEPKVSVLEKRAPLLICQGTKDVQVSPDKDAKRLLSMFLGAGRKDVTLKLFDGLDHLFKFEPGVSSMKSYQNAGRRVDPSFVSFLRKWLLAHAQ